MRKFLLKSSDILNILYENNILVVKSDISQFCTKFTKFEKIIYSKKDEKYFITTYNFDKKTKFEIEILKNEYKEALKISPVINKQSYKFSIEGSDFILDDYKDFAILEFDNKESNFNLSTIFENIDMKEIIDEKFYDELFFYKKSYLKFDSKKTIQAIKNSPFLELVFSDDIDAYKAFLILINQFNFQYLSTFEKYTLTKNSDFLYDLRQKIVEISSLLNEFKEIIDDEILTNLQNLLKQNLDNIDEIYKFKSLIDYFKTMSYSKKTVNSLEFVLKNQNEVFGFKKDFNYEIFLEDFNGFYKKDSKILKEFVARKIRFNLVLVQKKFNKLSSESLNSEFFEFKIFIDSLKSLLKSFYLVFDIKIIKKIYKEVLKLSIRLDDLYDRNSWCEIINLYDKGENKAFLKEQKDEISVFMFELRSKLIGEKSKFIDEARRSSKVLKVYYKKEIYEKSKQNH
ncbi:hypothetical protein [Campylobacter ureolyticus]|uniref:hypothetical protein n=1 Tax=Campylobacter ureolyticus TaxID=827 RepID=UPI002889E705|nr:hypothetical protein [Campylobacter ureolyticus]